MKTLELTELEAQIDYLIRAVERYKVENMSLQQKLASCARERSQLQENIQKANHRIRSIISQMKEELA